MNGMKCEPVAPREQSELEALLGRITRLAERGYEMASTVAKKREQYFGEEPKVEVSNNDAQGVIGNIHKRLGDLELFVDIAISHIERI